MGDDELASFYEILIFQKMLKGEMPDTDGDPFLQDLEISISGRAKVTFSESFLLVTPKRIDNALCIYLMDKTHPSEGTQEFTWYTTDFSHDSLSLQIEFSNPFAISAGGLANLDEL